MAHHAAKPPACANCDYAFVPGEPDEFCPRCGQQNHAVAVGFGHVAEEFLEGVFHFDGKVFSTLKLLLFRPGELTRRFLAGHRVPYVPPIRLYVFISFVFFFLLSLSSHHEGKESDTGVQIHVGPRAEVNKAVKTKPTKAIVFGPKMLFTKAQFDSLPENLTRAQADSVLRHHHMASTFSGRLVVQHMPRLRRLNQEELAHQAIKAVSIMLFVLMPLAALLLQVAYRRQRHYYISQLIFSVHLHCFVFVVLALLLGLDFLPVPEGTGLVLALLIPLYLVLALRRLYGQGWGLTLLKGTLLATSYTALLAVGLLAAIGLGLAVL